MFTHHHFAGFALINPQNQANQAKQMESSIFISGINNCLCNHSCFKKLKQVVQITQYNFVAEATCS